MEISHRYQRLAGVIMRGFILPFLFILVSGSLFGVTQAGGAQNIELSEVIISLHLEHTDLKQALDEIEKETELTFAFNFDRMNLERPVSIQAYEQSVEQILEQLFEDTGVSWASSGRVILLREEEEPEPAPENTMDVFQQVTGSVTDSETGEALPGVTIMVKGTDTGTSTNAEGFFELGVPSLSDTLVFSYIGYQTLEVPIQGETEIEVALQMDIIAGEELVVVGYGTRERATLTGSVSQISAQELQTTTSSDAINMMAGKLPGLRVNQQSGEPGNYDATFDIRGMGSPLIIVDGVPSTTRNFRTLDPNEIENISILKDASAAVYGVRAANGVIEVTTKRGTPGQTTLTYRTSVGVVQDINLPQTLNAYETALLKNEADFNAGLTTPRFSSVELENFRDGTITSTDWLGIATRDYAPQMEHNLSASGGFDRVQYFFSVGYLDEQGIWKTGDLNHQRYNLRSNITARITDDLEAELLLNGIQQIKNEPGETTYTIIRSAWMQDPTIPVYANNNPDYLSAVPGTWHPLASTNADISGYRERDDKAFKGILAFNYYIPFLEGARARFMYSHDRGHVTDKRWSQRHALYDYDSITDTYNPVYRFNPSTLSQSFRERIESVVQASLYYENTFMEAHNVDGLLLLEQRQLNDQTVNGSRQFTLDVVDQFYAGNTDNMQISSSGRTRFANQRLVGRVNYDYDRRYLLEGSFAYEGSSRFAEGHRWGFFPAVSAGWRITEESFLRDRISFLNDLKIRASWGRLGDDSASSFQFLSGFNYPGANYIFGNDRVVSGISPRGMPNPGITWFEATTMNAGLDISMWENRFYVEVDLFRRVRDNLLGTRTQSLPQTVGVGLPQENLNSDQTQGIEILARHMNMIGNLQYSISGNVSFTRSKILHQERLEDGNSYLNWRNNPNDRYTNVYWGHTVIGQFASQEEINNAPIQDGRGNSTLLPGDLRYEDWNGDGVIDANDMHPIGRAGNLPEVMFGMTFDVQWRGLDLNAHFVGATQHYTRYGPAQLEGPLHWDRGGLRIHMDRWHRADQLDPESEWVPGRFPSTRIPGSEGWSGNRLPSTFWLHDASYLRLKSLEIGYTFPQRIFGDRIRSLRVYLTGYNLLTWTGLDLIDPETRADENVGRGYEYPIPRSFNAGLSITF